MTESAREAALGSLASTRSSLAIFASKIPAPSTARAMVIGVSGASRSGKSYTAAVLAEALGTRAGPVISQDDFFSGSVIQDGKETFESPRCTDWRALHQHVHQQATTIDGTQRRYDFVIVEGFLLFHDFQMRELIDIAFHLHISAAEGKHRRCEWTSSHKPRTGEGTKQINEYFDSCMRGWWEAETGYFQNIVKKLLKDADSPPAESSLSKDTPQALLSMNNSGRDPESKPNLFDEKSIDSRDADELQGLDDSEDDNDGLGAASRPAHWWPLTYFDTNDLTSVLNGTVANQILAQVGDCLASRRKKKT
mmetsp:Transcript_7045/g.13320  ORF Transcript_7045/g.13320 Transcript_7045/m.13320 type:complete len:308 (+) Transcript_7045:55-978(+)